MNAIDAAIFLGDRLSRERALRDDETDALAAVIRICKRHQVWTAEMDRRLQQVRHRSPRCYANIIAREFNVTPMAVRTRMKKLKKHG